MAKNKFKFVEATVELSKNEIKFSVNGLQKINYFSNRKLPNSINLEELKEVKTQSETAFTGEEGIDSELVFETADDKYTVTYKSGLGSSIANKLGFDGEEGAERLIQLFKENKIPDNEELGVEASKDSNNAANTVKEYKRTCNECGKTWHSGVWRERELKGSELWDSCAEGIRACGGYYTAQAQHQKNKQDTKRELQRLKTCPDCGSKNYNEEVIEYEKK